MKRSLLCTRLIHLLAIGALLIVSLGTAQPATGAQVYYTFSNGITLSAAAQLPVFDVIPLQVDAKVTADLTQSFSGIYDRTITPDSSEDKLRPRILYINGKGAAILEQFNATGGFNAYSPMRAFGTDPTQDAILDPVAAQRSTCLFLLNKPALLPVSRDVVIPGHDFKCDFDFAKDPLYQVSTEFLTSLENVPGAKLITQPLRIMVTVPLLLRVQNYEVQSPDIPLYGPGGHISLLFDTTSPNTITPTLDSSIPGLQAIAMPAHGRNFVHTRNVPIQDPAKVKEGLAQTLKEAYPNSSINIPDPALVYFLSDPAEHQEIIEPVMSFSGVEITLPDDQVIALRDITLPAAPGGQEGLGPTLEIISPVNNFVQMPGKKTTFKGEVTGGKPPFQYAWLVEDETVLEKGQLDTLGSLPALEVVVPMPEKKGAVGSQSVYLVVTDAEGVTRQAMVNITVPTSSYLPLINNGAVSMMAPSFVSTMQTVVSRSASRPLMLAVNYSFGVEYGSDYPPYGAGGSDLPGVPGDANGFSSGMFSVGWPRYFNWYNANAWEKDWRDCTLGGVDCSSGVDRVDFVYYAGHGNKGGLAVPSNNHDSSWADGSNARFQKARWVGFASCKTLRAQEPAGVTPAITRWFNSFQGAHLLMGFNSNMRDVHFGGPLVSNMRIPSIPFMGLEFPELQTTISGAWVKTAFDLNAGKPAFLYATKGSINPSKDKLPKVGDPLKSRPNPPEWYHWVWWNE